LRELLKVAELLVDEGQFRPNGEHFYLSKAAESLFGLLEWLAHLGVVEGPLGNCVETMVRLFITGKFVTLGGGRRLLEHFFEDGFEVSFS
jgi:hypothetical protein